MPDLKHGFRNYLQPAFLICAAVLAIGGSSMSIAIKSFGLFLKKEPLPLKKSLDLLDENGLAPYKVISKSKIENERIVKELGTEDYIEWVLEDTDAPAGSPVGKCSLFITYYSLPDRVPHVPEECYMGVGYQSLASDMVTIKINKENGGKTLQVKSIVFSEKRSDFWQSDAKFSVQYFFNVNGRYTSNREQTRLTLNKNIRGKYSYFSKVEWNFFNKQYGTNIYPGEEESIAASEKLLSVILPILERDHWPEFGL